ncbi:MAG: gamma-glutamylcyclotransferase [Pseudomonadota bacterium]
MTDELTAHHRLATYGTLAPGRANHHQLDGMRGQWRKGYVRGTLVDSGWGAAEGYPGIYLGSDGTRVDVDVFESPDLPEHWPRLDEFEGTEYERVIADIHTEAGVIAASIYALRPEPAK